MHAPRARLSPVGLAMLSLLTLPQAHAQQAGDAAPTQLEQVLVSGQGRVQQLQSVPIAIQVMGGEQLKKLGAANLGDVASHVPGLAIDATQATQPRISLRGIGTEDFGIGTDSPVGIYVDGVYAGKTGGALLNFNDVKRIEVLKGPQGTLFGRNSAGGAISIVSNEPEFATRARAALRLGEHDLRHAELLGNTTLTQDLALRVNLVSQRGDGAWRDAGTGERAGGENAWGLRAALLWRASEDTKAQLTLEHEKLDQRARPAFGVVRENQAGTVPAFPADPAGFVDPRQAALRNDVLGDREARDFNGATLRIEHSLPWAEFSSTTAYRHFTSRNRQDNDGTANPLLYLSTTNEEASSSWQQEFRLSGKQEGMADWLAGLSLYSERARQTAFVDASTSSLDTLFGNVAGLPLFQSVNALAEAAGIPGVDLLGKPWGEAMSNEGRFKAIALYGDVIWQLSPQTRLSTGARLTHDDKRFSWFNPLRQATALDEQIALLDATQMFPAMVAAGALSQEQAELMQFALRNNALIATSGASAAALTRKKAWTDASPRLVLDHRVDRDLLLYGSLTRGYQAGGFNSLQVNSQYAPEKVTSLELGAKGGWPAAGLSVSASLFKYRYNNLQTLQLVPDAGGGIPAYQVSISDQQAHGLDLDLRWQATRALKLYGNLEWLDQSYRHGSSSSGHDLAGQPAGAPRLQATLGAELLWHAFGGQAHASLQASHVGATRCNEESVIQGLCLQTPNFRVGGARQRLDGRIGFDAADQRWGISLLGTNLLDKHYINRLWYESAPLGSAYATLAKPRTLSVELRIAY